MSVKKYSDYIALHEQKSKTIGLRSVDEAASSYTYDDMKAPRGADITSGRGDEINHNSVAAHLKSMGVPPEHVKAISSHLKKDDMDMDTSTKFKHGVMSKHGNLTVHSLSDPDSGKTKIRVEAGGTKSVQEATSYTYDDTKAPRGADLSSGRGDELDHKAVIGHLKSMGLPPEHIKAISAHLKKDDMSMDASTKLKDGVMSKHGDLTVHSFSDPDSGKTKIRVV